MPPEQSEDENAQGLPQDDQLPLTRAGLNPSDAKDPLDDTHPVTDTNIQVEELYDEGVSGAAEASEPNAGNDVIDYHPPESK